MKKGIVLVILAGLLISASVVFAEEKCSMGDSSMMGKGMRMHKGKTMPMMKQMQEMMKQMIQECPGMKDNEAMLEKMDVMMADTEQMMSKCMMMKKGMMGKEKPKEESGEAASDSEHESHH